MRIVLTGSIVAHETYTSDQIGNHAIDRRTGRVIGGPAFQIPGRIEKAIRDRQYNRVYDANGRLRGEQQRETLHLWRTPGPPGIRGIESDLPWYVALPRRLVDCCWFCAGVVLFFGLGCLGGAVAKYVWSGSPLAPILGFFVTLALYHLLFGPAD